LDVDPYADLDEEEGDGDLYRDGEGVWMRARARSLARFRAEGGEEGWGMICVGGTLGTRIETSISYGYFTSRLLIRLVINIRVCRMEVPNSHDPHLKGY
jgi:hypothetical protein